MTSLAALAHAAPPAPRPFDATYYATIATVIPVLYLAYALSAPPNQPPSQVIVDIGAGLVCAAGSSWRKNALTASPGDASKTDAACLAWCS